MSGLTPQFDAKLTSATQIEPPVRQAASNPNTHAYTPEMRAAAITLGLRLEVLTAETDSDLEESFRTMVRQSTDALVVMSDLFLIDRCKQLVALAAHHAVPAIYPILLFAEVGGLMSYGTPYVALYQRIGTYTGKLLKGAKPADLPIEQSTTFELVINLQTAKALGLIVPYPLLARADSHRIEKHGLPLFALNVGFSGSPLR